MCANQTRTQVSSAIVKVEKLSKTFGALKAVDSISFEIQEGEIFGLLGPNGAGKTTTINMLTTLLKPTSGNAQVCGYNIFKQANEVRGTLELFRRSIQPMKTCLEKITFFFALTSTAYREAIQNRIRRIF